MHRQGFAELVEVFGTNGLALSVTQRTPFRAEVMDVQRPGITAKGQCSKLATLKTIAGRRHSGLPRASAYLPD
jgi:hypothetical protein